MNVYLSSPAVFCCCAGSAGGLWNSVTSGNRSGIKKVTALNGKEFYAARIDDSLLKEPASARYDMRIIRIEEKCIMQISDLIEKARDKFGASRIGVCVGSCDNGTEFSVAGHREFFNNGEFSPAYALEMQGADYVATYISEAFGLTGPSMTFSTACSSSAGALIKACELVQAGVCDAVVAGGVDIASDTTLIGFDALEAVSPEMTNPFSKNRHGITLGDAAAFFLVSHEDFSESRIGILGYGETADAYHMTSPDPTGDGAARAMKSALSKAGLKPEQIDYVNLHGTGTKFNDLMEGRAMEVVFGGYKVPCSTTKSMTGHTLGAAGALEAGVCFQAILNGRTNAGRNEKNGGSAYPLHVWDGQPDPEIPSLNLTDRNFKPEGTPVRICMTNSFAFGGSNVSLIIGELK